MSPSKDHGVVSTTSVSKNNRDRLRHQKKSERDKFIEENELRGRRGIWL